MEADVNGHESIGFEINPYAAFAARLKLEAHDLSPARLRRAVEQLLAHADKVESNGALPRANAPSSFRTRSPFYAPEVERKVLLLHDFVQRQSDLRVADMLRLAFASTMVEYSNYSYEPSLGRRVSAGRAPIDDYPVTRTVADKLSQMADDAEWYQQTRVGRDRPSGQIRLQSFFDAYEEIDPSSIDLLITSPPYANNYHYNRNTRPQLYWLDFCHSTDELRELERQNFGTYWQRARELENVPLDSSISFPDIHRTLDEIRKQNPDRGIYGGTGWANYLATYLNDCVRFVEGMTWCLKSGGTGLVVIGNSIIQGVPVPTDRFLASIAEEQGMTVVRIHSPRATRVGNSIINSSVRAGKGRSASLYESVVEIRRR